uniref:Putative bifunctional protein (CbiGH) n=1 Tax=Neisseria meningitidis alpha275 TaxID=295996 RepID=C6SHE7_NEIME|nr:putative bifunctional protein (CbiGH) [Neisseria meningitidis alpha275]
MPTSKAKSVRCTASVMKMLDNMVAEMKDSLKTEARGISDGIQTEKPPRRTA